MNAACEAAFGPAVGRHRPGAILNERSIFVADGSCPRPCTLVATASVAVARLHAEDFLAVSDRTQRSIHDAARCAAILAQARPPPHPHAPGGGGSAPGLCAPNNPRAPPARPARPQAPAERQADDLLLLAESLVVVPVLEQLPHAALLALCGQMTLRSYKRGQLVFEVRRGKPLFPSWRSVRSFV